MNLQLICRTIKWASACAGLTPLARAQAPGLGLACLMAGLLLLTSCATEGTPPLAMNPLEDRWAPDAQVMAAAGSHTEPETAEPEVSLTPPAELVPVLNGPASDLSSYVLARPQAAKEKPVSQKPSAVSQGPVRAEVAPVQNGPAGDLSSYALAKPQAAKEKPVSQKLSQVSAGPIRVVDVELQDVKQTIATVLIKSDRPILNYKSFTLSNPPRIVIDIQEAIDALPKRVKSLSSGPIKKIRSSQFRRRPVGIARVVLVLSSKLPYLPYLPYRIQATSGPLKIVVGEAVTKVTARSLLAAEVSIASVPPAVRAPVQLRMLDLPGLSKRISIDLRQIDILAVMKFLAEEGDLNIATGKNVGGRVRLFLKSVTIRDVLDIVALTYELAYVVQNGIIHVMTEADYQRLFGASFADQRQIRRLQLKHGDPTSVAALLGNMKSAVGRVIADAKTRTIVLIDVPEKLEQMVATAESMDKATQMQTEVFELRYAKAEEIAPEVEKVITPEIGAVRLDKRTNTLVVTDLLPKMPEVRKVISAFDRKTREVLIEAMILEVTLNDKYQVGVDWEKLFKSLKNLDFKSTFPILPAVATSGKLTVGVLEKNKFSLAIEALQTVGATNILSKPQILVVENQEAIIHVGTKEPFVSSALTQTQQAATTAEEITFIDVGVTLKVTPSINQDGFVTMKIRPEVSSVTETLTTASGNVIPIVAISEAETTVMVKDGTTIVIAGLIQDETKENTQKVPFLGDIPILKYAFQNWHESVDKKELVIFLTPTIISGQESVAGVSALFEKKKDKEKSKN